MNLKLKFILFVYIFLNKISLYEHPTTFYLLKKFKLKKLMLQIKFILNYFIFIYILIF